MNGNTFNTTNYNIEIIPIMATNNRMAGDYQQQLMEEVFNTSIQLIYLSSLNNNIINTITQNHNRFYVVLYVSRALDLPRIHPGLRKLLKTLRGKKTCEV